MNDTPELAYRQQILALQHGYRPAQILITCAELGVFTALAAGPLPPGVLADALPAETIALPPPERSVTVLARRPRL